METRHQADVKGAESESSVSETDYNSGTCRSYDVASVRFSRTLGLIVQQRWEDGGGAEREGEEKNQLL